MIINELLHYSINQTSREALYVPLNDEKRYQAKAFIDIFVMRGAKVLAILLSLLISSVFSEFKTLKWLSFVIVIFVGLWLIAVNYAGRKYQKLTQTNE